MFDIFRRGKKKFEKWSKYLNMEDEGHRVFIFMGSKNREGIIVLQNSVTGEVRLFVTIEWVVVNGIKYQEVSLKLKIYQKSFR